MADNKSFEVDWKFTAGDLIYNAEAVVGKLPLEYVGERQVNGEWKDVVNANNQEILFPYDNSIDALFGIMGLINNQVAPKGKWFKNVDTQSDSFGFQLIDFPYGLPAASKYFTLYFVTATDPNEKDVVLSLGNNRFFASKVDVDESILPVIQREILDLTGSNKYTLIDVRPKGTAADNFGNQIPRSIVDVRIPYFDPAKTHTKYHVEWAALPRP